MNTLFVENKTEKWQNYSQFCVSKNWCSGWAINYNAGTNGLGYRTYDYVIIGEELGEGESPLQFAKYIIQNKIKVGCVVLYIDDFEIRNILIDEFTKNNYNVKCYAENWEKTICEYTQVVNEV